MLKYRGLLVALFFLVSANAFAERRWTHTGCENQYEALFSEPEINITVAFGYFDYGDGDGIETGDLFEYQQFTKYLTNDCDDDTGNRVCGFKESEGANSFQKVFTKEMLGPDGLMRTFKITTGHGSETTADKINRNGYLQKDRSASMREMFLKGLKKSQVVLYSGHSRDGGGPDFDPSVLKNGHTDYDWYHHHPQDKKDMMQALSENPDASRLVVLASCSSIRWFSKGIENAAPSVGMMGTTDSATTFQLDKIFNSLFNFKCLSEMDFHDSVHGADMRPAKKWAVPESLSNTSPSQMEQKIYENLAKNLHSNELQIRRDSYRELSSHKRSSLPPSVQNEMAAYEMMKSVMSVFGDWQ